MPLLPKDYLRQIARIWSNISMTFNGDWVNGESPLMCLSAPR